MLQVSQDAQGAGHDIVTARSPQVRYETHTTGIVFEPAVVKPFGCGRHHQNSCRHVSAELRCCGGDDAGPAATRKLRRDYMTGESLTSGYLCAFWRDLVLVRRATVR